MKLSFMHRAMPIKKLSAVAVAITILGACQGGDADTAANAKDGGGSGSDGTVLTSAIGDTPELSVSSKLIAAAQLGTALDGQGSYTVFFPLTMRGKQLRRRIVQQLKVQKTGRSWLHC